MKILRIPYPSEIKYVIEESAYEFWKTLFTADPKNVDCEEREEFFKFSSGIPIYMLNGVLNTKIPNEIAEETIKDIISFFEKKNLPFSWITGPSSKPDNLNELLLKNGLTLALEAPGMACNLNKLSGKNEMISSLEIIEVENAKTLKLWNDVLMTGFEFPKESFDLFYKMVSLVFLNDNPSASAFLAYYNGKPIATSAVICRFGVAGIYCIATLKEERGRGIGSQITLAPLYKAKTLGYEIAILHSTEMGINIYKRLGFKEYCKVNRFVWNPNLNT